MSAMNAVVAVPGAGAGGDPCGFQPDGSPRCTRPSTVRNTAACVHEHVSTGVDCDEHAAWLVTGTWMCGACRDLGHDCPVTVVITNGVAATGAAGQREEPD